MFIRANKVWTQHADYKYKPSGITIQYACGGKSPYSLYATPQGNHRPLRAAVFPCPQIEQVNAYFAVPSKRAGHTMPVFHPLPLHLVSELAAGSHLAAAHIASQNGNLALHTE